MDYRDIEKGGTEDFFYFRGKLGLVDILIRRASAIAKGRRGLKILSLGAGVGGGLETTARYGELYIIDSDPRAIELASDRLCKEKKVYDITEGIPYPDSFFDMVTAFDVLEHIKDDEMVCAEVYRVLKPGGSFVFTTPAFQPLFSDHDRALGHYRRYNKDSLKKLLCKFKPLELDFWMFTLFLPISAAKLLKRKNNNPSMHNLSLPGPVNSLFCVIMDIENWLIKHRVRLPLGTTAYGIFKAER